MPKKATDPNAAFTYQEVVVRARNGDVIRSDETGLVLNLSDRVIADIALRLGASQDGRPTTAHTKPSIDSPNDLRLEKLDVWDVTQNGDWWHFTGRLPGKQGVRRYRLAAAGGDVLADSPGQLFAILGIGGARAALADDRPADFPQHILAPADGIGAVGHAGTSQAAETPLLEHLTELTHEALTAEAFLNWQLEKHAPLPLFLARVETDESADAAALANGAGLQNLLVAAANAQRAATSMGKTLRLLSVTLDYSLEDTSGSAIGYRDGVLKLMSRIEAGLADLGIPAPLFVTRFDRGSASLPDHHAIEGQWELIWNHGDHDLIFSAPGYMFAHDDTDRPTPEARCQMAEMTAAAVSDPKGWRCPVFHLAELSTARKGFHLKLRARAASQLVLEQGDAACEGHSVGLRLIGDTAGAKITSVELDPSDNQALLITLDRLPTGADLRLGYAIGAAVELGQPAHVAVRDTWELASKTGTPLHRWALPCLLPIHSGEDVHA